MERILGSLNKGERSLMFNLASAVLGATDQHFHQWISRRAPQEESLFILDLVNLTNRSCC